MRREQVGRKEKFVDISNAPIARGDLLKIWNDSKEVKRTFQILDIEEEEGIRKITGTLIDSDNPEERVGTEVTFELPRHQVILGAHIPMTNKFDSLTGQELNDLMAFELYKFLMGRPASNYGMKFQQCVTFLREAGFIPKTEEYKLAQARVRAMMRQRADMFRSSGGVIFGTGVNIDTPIKPSSVAGGGNIVTIRRVKLSKVNAGIRLLLESGLFGDCILEE